MILGRLIRSLGAEKHSLIRTSWLTKFFLLGDALSIAAQGIGGGILSNADTLDDFDRGQTIIIIGLAIQILFFGLFVVVSCLFHYRIRREPTALSSRSDATWQKLLYVLYSTSALILIRSLFRMIEYILGHDSVLQSTEVYIYIFDALLMAAVAIIFNFFHPSKLLGTSRKPSLDVSNSEMQLGSYDAVPTPPGYSESH
ncbi:Fc.00g116180.m01.CDS01 [Cosmosporella sp. VM-42]